MTTRLFRLALTATAAMYLVLLAGVLVTTTGSADGCGASWPLCHGRVLPALRFSALVEFGHRAISGIAGILVVVVAVALWRRFPGRLEARALATGSIFFLLLQAILGAMAVLWPQPKAVLALHFGISLVSFAFVLLSSVFIYQQNHPAPRAAPDPRLRWWSWFSLGYIYVVVYLGALVRHTGSGLACTHWPLCRPELPFPLYGPAGIHFTHRLAAAVALLVLLRLVFLARRTRRERPDLYRGSLAAVGLLLVQALSGAIQLYALLATPYRMLHSATMMLLFGALAYVCMQVTLQPGRTASLTPASQIVSPPAPGATG